MSASILWIPILLPVIGGLGVFLLPRSTRWCREILYAMVAAVTFAFCLFLFVKRVELHFFAPWTLFDINYDLLADHFARFILLAAAGFELLLAIYSISFMDDRWRKIEYFAYSLFISGAVNGAILANNFVLLLFFLGSVLPFLYAVISTGHKGAYETAGKALMLAGIGDFCMVLGIICIWYLTGSLTLSEIHLEPSSFASVAFILMVIGATAKAGAIPLHTWIPDAAVDAPAPFMAFLPGSLEKLLGIYLLSRICLQFFTIPMNGGLSITLMTLGALTIVLAVLMALIQKDYKRLLAFHAISQVGYMILGIGTGVPIGIAGGIFHMLNNSMYKSLLFLTAGSMEKQTGTTSLEKLGGMIKIMPVTGVCFWIAAFSIAGVPPFNGFVSKEMVFHGAHETGYTIFLIAAWIGAVFTFASFLKLGHSVYFGKCNEDISKKNIKDSSWLMLVPMIILAVGCVLFGVYSELPLKYFIEPVLQNTPVAHGHTMEFWKHAYELSWIAEVSIGCLIAALLLHMYGVIRAKGKAYLASEPVHNLPLVHQLYNLAEKRAFDLYEWITRGLKFIALIVYIAIDRGIDFIHEKVVVGIVNLTGQGLSLMHNGVLQNYAIWVIIGVGLIIYSLVKAVI